jgi:two-component system, NtrC family, nitrogen regulation sensor histidine kinase NtrY
MKRFGIGIVIRIVLIILFAFIASWSWVSKNFSLTTISFAFIAYLAFNLYYYTTSLNKKLSRIFDSIQFQDFAITFRADNAKGDSFKAINNSLNAVIKSFNQVRAEREASLHFIQAIIQHINVGIFSYTTDGKIEIINEAASKLLGIYKLNHISSIKTHQPEIYQLMTTLASGESKLLKISNIELSLSIKEIMLRDRKIRLIALHNIRSELQRRELEAWQNLTKVLRHEIMNTVTPIVSLSETMRDIIENDLDDVTGPKQVEGVEDLKNAITTVINRSKGIMNFVNAYREFTNIPLPKFEDLSISQVFDGLKDLFEQDYIKFEIKNNFNFPGDSDQIIQVFINLIKNAIEATASIENPSIKVRAYSIQQNKIIEVIDNGEGVSVDDVDKIFVPFFTTKSTGSGIGLSLSRQIIQMHVGRLDYEPVKPSGSRFYIAFG